MKLFKAILLIALTATGFEFTNMKANTLNTLSTSLIYGTGAYLFAKGSKMLLADEKRELSAYSIYQLLKKTYLTKPRDVFWTYADDYVPDFVISLSTGSLLGAASIALGLNILNSPEHTLTAGTSYVAGTLIGLYSFDAIKKHFEFNKHKQESEQQESENKSY